jgi:hypothetical protein
LLEPDCRQLLVRHHVHLELQLPLHLCQLELHLVPFLELPSKLSFHSFHLLSFG